MNKWMRSEWKNSNLSTENRFCFAPFRPVVRKANMINKYIEKLHANQLNGWKQNKCKQLLEIVHLSQIKDLKGVSANIEKGINEICIIL